MLYTYNLNLKQRKIMTITIDLIYIIYIHAFCGLLFLLLKNNRSGKQISISIISTFLMLGDQNDSFQAIKCFNAWRQTTNRSSVQYEILPGHAAFLKLLQWSIAFCVWLRYFYTLYLLVISTR